MKLHFLSDSFKVSSGFGIVGKNLAIGLKNLGYKVSATGFQTSYHPEYYKGIKIYPLATDKAENIQLINNLLEENPDLIIYIGDMYTDVSYLAKIPLQLGKKVAVHCPIEGNRIPKRMINDLKEIIENGGKIIPQSKYGKKEMEKYGIKTEDFSYHGYDPNIFKKLDLKGMDKDHLRYCYYDTEICKMISDPDQIKKQGCYHCNEIHQKLSDKRNCPYYKEEEFTFLKWFDDSKEAARWTELIVNPSHLTSLFKGKFVFTFIGANISFRKRPERLMEAYAKLVGESRMIKDRVWLHMHTIPNGTTGFDLLEIANDLGIKENISFSYGMMRNNTLSDEAINILLNMSDCFVSATSSEGMSINHLLAMAVGLPCISPNNTVMTELIGDVVEDPTNTNKTIGPRGLLANIKDNYTLSDLSKRSLVDINDLAFKMKQIYNNKNLIEQYSNNAIKFAQNYTWDRICSGWNKSLKEWKELSDKNTL